MESGQEHRNRSRIKRKMRIRKKLRGSSDKPRMCVVKSNQHIYVQLIDDEVSKTLASISTLNKEFRSREVKKNKETAHELGLKLAGIAKQKNIAKVVLDRGCRMYHGLIAALADGAREGGMEF